ncbi:hypothetical protein MLD38_009462 [Melastoma candidum]|nr:hypothetical protein MLD38_009462 [Melastoma candidum]
MGLTLDNHISVPSFPRVYGDNVIVGILDTGIWPESKSFREEPAMGPIPSSWKGRCVVGNGFDPKVALGSIVLGASFNGLGPGTARGGAPRSRLAMYKVCWGFEGAEICDEADIMSAFDAAICDGVHVISASLANSGLPLLPYVGSCISIGSFHAMQAGISTVFSAGNYDEPVPSHVQNVQPWSISVAASTIDRDFPTKIVLGNGLSFVGESLMTEKLEAHLEKSSTFFFNGSCRAETVKCNASGYVILCFSMTTSGVITSTMAAEAVHKAGGAGVIYVEPLSQQIPDVFPIPLVYIDFYQGSRIRSQLFYSGAEVVITPSKAGVTGKVPSPVVAYFSCRGPSSLSPDILKPDISAPGVNILAAWPPFTPTGPSTLPGRFSDWNFQSGTSMSTPHVAGVIALIKSAHPDWSPAEIRSAIMTTAYTGDTVSETIQASGPLKHSDPFDVGAGHMDPVKVMDPGLVYDMTIHDYILFLCNMGYNTELIKKLAPSVTACPESQTPTSNLNYPSITVSDLRYTTTIKRTVRNVGNNRQAMYFPRVVSPSGVEVSVWPRVMFFSWYNRENTYYVILKPIKRSKGRCDFGEIVWSDGFHKVRSPLTVCVNNIDSDLDYESNPRHFSI